jgi:hypothetical protein
VKAVRGRYVIVDVGGETVLIEGAAPADKSDQLLLKTQKVLGTVSPSTSSTMIHSEFIAPCFNVVVRRPHRRKQHRPEVKVLLYRATGLLLSVKGHSRKPHQRGKIKEEG